MKLLHAISTFPTGYTYDDLVRYVTMLELQTYGNLELIARQQARIHDLERQLEAARKVNRA
ncbi:hypothetical protein [Paraburkholderia sp. JHI869]|uniref:hypothetical protein n=1 Tax=Paraburkholderia sp. JHI869 TaxID=3112959 RepID=UPI00319E39A0